MIEKIKEKLKPYYFDVGVERTGFILQDGSIVEVRNICDDPEDGFLIADEDVLKYAEQSYGFWHTHPGVTSNLSGDDYTTFAAWRNLIHFIVGKDGVRAYQFDKAKGAVVELLG